MSKETKDIIVSCNSCNTKYKIRDKIVGENGRFVRCSKCEHEWLLLPEKDKIHYDDKLNTKNKDKKTQYNDNSKLKENEADEKITNDNRYNLKYAVSGLIIILMLLFSLLIIFEDSTIVVEYFSGPRKVIKSINSFVQKYKDDSQAHLVLENVIMIDKCKTDKLSMDENDTTSSHHSNTTNINDEYEDDINGDNNDYDILQFFITNTSESKVETISRIRVICYTDDNKIAFQDIVMTNKIIYPGKRAVFTINTNGRFHDKIHKVKIYANDKLIGTEYVVK